jgi:hypothetical protein
MSEQPTPRTPPPDPLTDIRAQGSVRSRNGARGHDPVDRLSPNGGDEVEVAIVVKDRERGARGEGRDQQIRDARTAMLALPRQKLHHVDRGIEFTLFDIDRGKAPLAAWI